MDLINLENVSNVELDLENVRICQKPLGHDSFSVALVRVQMLQGCTKACRNRTKFLLLLCSLEILSLRHLVLNFIWTRKFLRPLKLQLTFNCIFNTKNYKIVAGLLRKLNLIQI